MINYMASKKKPGAVAEDAVSGKPVKGKKRVNPDGTPFVPTPRRPDAVILAEYKEKRERVLVRHAKELARIDAKISFFSNRGAVDPAEAEATVKEMLGKGMTPEDIEALEKKLRAARKYLASKAPEDIAALVPVAQEWDDEEDEESED